MFETDRFIQECCDGLRETNAHAAIRDIVARAVVEPREVLTSLGEPKLSGLQTLFRSETLTILKVLWGPGMSLYPHDHRMWAVIGIYSGREDNAFFQRSEWEPQTVQERTFDFEHAKKVFAESNKRLASAVT